MTDRYVKLSDILRVLGSYSQDEMSDYIKRSDALDSLYAEALIYNFDSVQDGDAKRYARAAQRCIAGIPAADVLENGRIKSGVFEALRILDAINGTGRMDYGDYCDLHDAISSIMDGGDKR